jgi:muskelin
LFSDFLLYDIGKDKVIELARDTSKFGGPSPGFTQRLTLDPLNGDLFVLSGRVHDPYTNSESVKNSFWHFSLDTRKWECVYHNDNEDPTYWDEMRFVEPCPRYAHQMVYDTVDHIHYLFGGNPGEPTNPNLRLDDFWSLKLSRITSRELISMIKFIIRKQQFMELCMAGKSLEALQFLRTKLYEVTNHQDEAASSQFRKLATNLCQPPSSNGN